jgi:3-oxoacyl-[acyl-carrier-protein] synthase-3
MRNKKFVKILGSAKFLPSKQVSAAEIDEKLKARKGWTADRIGVMSRYFVEHETTVDMGAAAAKDALKAAKLSASDLKLILAASAIPQQPIPCNAALLQQALGLEDSGIPGFDINSTCLSFVTGLDMASYLVHEGRHSTALIVSSDISSLGLNWNDKESAPLFGDGAAAVVLGQTPKGEQSHIITTHMETYSSGADACMIQGGLSKFHASKHTAETAALYQFQMNGKKVFRKAFETMEGFLDRGLTPVKLNLSDFKVIIMHQASLPALTLMQKKLGIRPDQTFNVVQDYGNCIAASIPMCLHEAISTHRISRGDKVLLLGTSAGFSLGLVALEY